MNEAVFISDLHLNPNQPDITAKFLQFCRWCGTHTKSLYILGDFFHLWVGDDDTSEWVEPIVSALIRLRSQGVETFFMGGNRDFLVGKHFCRRAQLQPLTDATQFHWHNQIIALTHGDRLCSNDKQHQWFYWLTRNRAFRWFFNRIPLSIRYQLAHSVRKKSQANKPKQKVTGQVTLAGLKRFLKKVDCQIIIHGHTHQPALHKHVMGKQVISRYVLSDWDDKVSVLCYDNPKGFYFYHL